MPLAQDLLETNPSKEIIWSDIRMIFIGPAGLETRKKNHFAADFHFIILKKKLLVLRPFP